MSERMSKVNKDESKWVSKRVGNCTDVERVII